MIAEHQVVGDLHEREAQAAVGALDQPAAEVHLIALISAGIKPGASRDAACVGIVADRPHLGGVSAAETTLTPGMLIKRT